MYAITAAPMRQDGTLGQSFNIAVFTDEQRAIREMREREKIWLNWSLCVVPVRRIDDDDDDQPDEAQEWADFDPDC